MFSIGAAGRFRRALAALLSNSDSIDADVKCIRDSTCASSVLQSRYEEFGFNTKLLRKLRMACSRTGEKKAEGL